MKETLRAGLEGVYRYRVPESKTVPRIYAEAPDFQLMEGRRLVFAVSAHDGVDAISEGLHERHVIDAERFERKISDKCRRVGAA